MTRQNFTPKQKLYIRATGGWMCSKCCAFAYEVDHKAECWDGGTNDVKNGQLLCVPCHKVKSAEGRTFQATRRKFTPDKARAVKRKAKPSRKMQGRSGFAKGRKLSTKEDRERITK